MSMERQKFISGTSDGRGSPELSESNTVSQRRSTGLWKGNGPAVDSTSPPKPLKATSITFGFFARNLANASRRAVSFLVRISSGFIVFCLSAVAASKYAKSNLNMRIPRSYQYCKTFMKSERKPPSKSDIVHPLVPIESFHCGAALICTSALVPNHIPGRMPFSWQAAIHLSAPFGQLGLRQVRYPPSGANQKASIM